MVWRKVNNEARGIFLLRWRSLCDINRRMRIVRADDIPDLLDAGRWAPGRLGELLPSEWHQRGVAPELGRRLWPAGSARSVPRCIWRGRVRLRLTTRCEVTRWRVPVLRGACAMDLPIFVSVYGPRGEIILVTVEDAGGLRPWAPVGWAAGAGEITTEDMTQYAEAIDYAYRS